MNTDDIELIEDTNGTTSSDAPEGIDEMVWKQWMDEEELKKDKFLWQLKRGIDGHNVGLDNGLPNISKYLYGTHKARYYLLGAESSVGKTTIADFMYVFKAWESAKKLKRPIKIFYFSYEIGKIEKIYRWCSYFIFLKYKVQLSSDYIQGRIHGMRITKEHSLMVLYAYSVIKELLLDVTIIENSLTPTRMFNAMVEEYFEKHGAIKRAPISKEATEKGKKGAIQGYAENDPDLTTIIIMDHLALGTNEPRMDTKIMMDTTSKYCIVLRNMFHATPVIIQQFSTDMMSAYRGAFGKKTEGTIAPQRLDFGDSKATFRDADVVMGGTKPQREMSKFNGYDISLDGLGDYFVAWYLMKNRYGPSNRLLPLFLDPIVGIPYDLPLDPNNLFAIQEWIDKAQKLEQLCQTFSPK